MAGKTDFTPDEWKALLASPMIVGMSVLAADPSGLFGMLKESMASARALVAAKTDPNADALVKAVAADFETSEGRGLAQEGVKAAISGSSAADIKPKGDRRSRSGRRDRRREGPGRRASLQDVACRRGEVGGRGFLRRRVSRLRRRTGKRGGEGDAR